MKRRLTIAAVLLAAVLLLLSACSATKITFPYFEYRNSSFDFDVRNRTILLQDGFALHDGHPYDVIETDEGYDMVFHFVRETEE